MTNVYIVTSGAYSDYGIDCVFSTEEAAEAYCDRKNRSRHNYASYDTYRVEEYELDAIKVVDRTTKIAFKVSYMEKIDPLSRMVSGSQWYVNGDDALNELPFDGVLRRDKEEFSFSRSTWWETWVWADNEQEARKIGADRLTPYLADANIELIPDTPAVFDRHDTPFLKSLQKKVTIGDYTDTKAGGITTQEESK